MDTLSAFFIVLMVVLGGVSAYVADILGYKIGKKRLSLWHIRPKYIARTAVVIAGALIPLVTILILYAASANFRIWLQKGQQAIEESKQNLKALDQSYQERTKAENKVRIADQNLKTKQKELENQDTKLKAQEENLKKLNDGLVSLKANIEKNKIAYDKTNRQLGTTMASLKNAQTSLSQTKTALANAKREYEDEKKRFQEVKSQYDTTSSRNLKLTADNLELSNKNQELDTANKNLQSSLTELQGNIAGLTKQIDGLKKDKASADKDAEEARSNLQKIQDALIEVQIQSKKGLNNFKEVFLTSRLEFGIGEEMARVSVGPRLSESDARTLYRNLMRKIRAIATERGAKPVDRTVVSEQDFPIGGVAGFLIYRSSTQALSEEEVEDFWVSRLKGQKENAVFVVRVSTNRFLGDPVTLAGEVFSNPIAFRKGEIVSEIRIDARQSDNEIRSGIHDFLRTYVNTKARTRRMIPVTGRDGDSYGEFTEEQFFDIFARIKTVTRQVRLVAIARDDTRVGDSLLIDLEIH